MKRSAIEFITSLKENVDNIFSEKKSFQLLSITIINLTYL